MLETPQTSLTHRRVFIRIRYYTFMRDDVTGELSRVCRVGSVCCHVNVGRGGE